MKNSELINELDVLFGKNRTGLRDKLKETVDKLEMWDGIGAEIHKKTNQPIRGMELISEEMHEAIKNPDAKFEDIGDCCFYYEMVLNSGIKDGLDWDMDLTENCKGGSKICTIWANLLFPYYAIDYHLMTYKREIDEVEILPYKPTTKREMKIVEKIKDIFKANGFKLISTKLAKTVVPKAMTDVKGKGEATVFDCLFSDIHYYTDYYSRFSCFGENGQNKLDHIYPGTEIRWREKLNKNNKVIERYISIDCPSGETIHIDLDNKYKISKIILSNRGNEMTLDVKNKKLNKKK